MNELITISKLKQAQLAIRDIKELDDIKKLIDQSEALRHYAEAQHLSQEMIDDVTEYHLYATRQMGEISAGIEKAHGNRFTGDIELAESASSTKTIVLAEAGIPIRRANEAEQLAAIPEEEFAGIIAGKREAGNLTKSSVFADIKREQKREQIIEKLNNIKSIETKELQGMYDVIVIDPPWDMKKIERDERPNQSEFDYPTMTENELTELKIPAADDCHIWVWTTHKFMPMAFRLLDKWDFKYVCTFVWHKPGGFQPFGLPQYNCEFVLYARKGTPEFIETKAFPTCFEAGRGTHSEKPEEFYDMVRRVTAGRRLDMFNRRTINGFDVWGKES